MTYNYDDDAPTNQYPAELVPDAMGYTPIALTDDGDVLCESCVLDQSNPVHSHPVNETDGADGWGVVGWTYDGECESLLLCAHCGRVLVDEPA